MCTDWQVGTGEGEGEGDGVRSLIVGLKKNYFRVSDMLVVVDHI